MEAVLTEPVQTEVENNTAKRSKLYSLFAEMFRYPDENFRRQVKNRDLENALHSLFNGFPYILELDDGMRSSLRVLDDVEDEEIETEFIRLFEAGPGSPPCPLVEGLFREDRKAIFKELILFYNHFGLSYGEGSMEDRPDHLCYELEFLHFLTFKELLSIQKDEDASPYVRAQKDFIKRHLLSWIGKLLAKISEIKENLPGPGDACIEVFEFYGGNIRLLNRFLEKDYEYIESLKQ